MSLNNWSDISQYCMQVKMGMYTGCNYSTFFPTFGLVINLNFDIVFDVKWHLKIILISLSQMTNDPEYLLIWLLVISALSLWTFSVFPFLIKFLISVIEHWGYLCWSVSHVRLCNLMGCGLPGSSVHGILQASKMEWVAISFSRGLFMYSKCNFSKRYMYFFPQSLESALL